MFNMGTDTVLLSEGAAVDYAGDFPSIHFDLAIFSDVKTVTQRHRTVLSVDLVLGDGRGERRIESRNDCHDLPQNLMQ